MSLAAAIALVSAKAAQKRRRANDDDSSDIDDIDPSIMSQVEREISYPNITLYGGDYHGNLLGVRIVPPEKSFHKATDGHDIDSDHDDEEDAPKQMTAITRFLARERGIDPLILENQRKQKYHITLQPVASGQVHAGGVVASAVHGNTVATAGGQDETIKLARRNGQSNKIKEFGSLNRHDSSLTTLCYSPDGQLLISAGGDGVVYAWSTFQWDCIGVLKHHTCDVIGLAIHPTVPLLLSLCRKNKLAMWSLRPGEFHLMHSLTLRKMKPIWGTVALSPLSLIFSTNGDYYSILYSRCVCIYHTIGERAGKQIRRIDYSGEHSLVSQAYLDNDHILLGTEKGDVLVHNVISGDLVATFTGQHQRRVKSIIVLSQAATGWLSTYLQGKADSAKTPTSNTTTTTVEPSRNKKKTRKSGAKAGVDSPHVQLTPTVGVDPQVQCNGQFIVTADSDGVIVLWHITLEKGSEISVDITVKLPKEKSKKSTKTFYRKKSDDDDDDDDDSDGDALGDDDDINDDEYDSDQEGADDADADVDVNPTLTYSIMTQTMSISSQFIAKYGTNTRLTCLSVGYPLTPEYNHVQPVPRVNIYQDMDHVEDTASTRYEDPTDKIYQKKRADYVRSIMEDRMSDSKKKKKGGREPANVKNEYIKGFGKERYRRLDEEYQREYQEQQKKKAMGLTSGPKARPKPTGKSNSGKHSGKHSGGKGGKSFKKSSSSSGSSYGKPKGSFKGSSGAKGGKPKSRGGGGPAGGSAFSSLSSVRRK